MPRHLHPTIPAYVGSQSLADSYDDYFADSALFRHDERFLDEHLRLTPPFAHHLLSRPPSPPSPSPGTPSRRALDLGCGTGRHLLRLARAGWYAVGVDLNEHMLQHARAKLEQAGLARRVRLLRADWHALPLDPDDRFDAVLLFFSALGLVRPAARRRALLAALRARLAPGGRLFVHVHNARYQPPEARGDGGTWPRWREGWRGIFGGGSDAGQGTPTPEAVRPPPSAPDAALPDPRAGEDAAEGWEEGDRWMPHYRGSDVDLLLHAFGREELAGLLGAAGYAVAEWRSLSDDRASAYRGRDPDREANGFLVCAVPAPA